MTERIPIGVVGLRFGRHMLEYHLLAGPGSSFFQPVAVCDLDAVAAADIAARHGLKAYPALDALLADQAVRAVALFTGPAGRAETVRRIVRAGKDVMTTKPFDLDPDATLDVLREAKRLGRVVHLNSPAPVLPPDLLRIRRWQQQYDLGRPLAARFETWANYREQPDGGWYDDPARCPVAPIFRLGIYGINDLVQFFGEGEAVQVMHARLFTRRPTPDHAQLGIRFKGGGLACVFASFCVADGIPYPDRLDLNFERGSIYRATDHWQGTGRFDDPRDTILNLVAGRGVIESVRETATFHNSRSGDYQWETFYRAIRGEKIEEDVTPEQIAAAVRIIRAMARAEASGQVEAV